jgi:hypothetical protein
VTVVVAEIAEPAPPGRGSIVIGSGIPSGVSLPGPICSSSASNVASSDACTRISCVMFNVRFSTVGAVVTTALYSFFVVSGFSRT